MAAQLFVIALCVDTDVTDVGAIRVFSNKADEEEIGCLTFILLSLGWGVGDGVGRWGVGWEGPARPSVSVCVGG